MSIGSVGQREIVLIYSPPAAESLAKKDVGADGIDLFSRPLPRQSEINAPIPYD
jgi:hypothetical protein